MVLEEYFKVIITDEIMNETKICVIGLGYVGLPFGSSFLDKV